ncbi:MAG: hypothetical protein ACREP6_06415 [Candidatus Binataceae bacterium]
MNLLRNILSIVIRMVVSIALPLWGAVILALGAVMLSWWWIVTGIVILIIGLFLAIASPLLRPVFYDS